MLPLISNLKKKNSENDIHLIWFLHMFHRVLHHCATNASIHLSARSACNWAKEDEEEGAETEAAIIKENPTGC